MYIIPANSKKSQLIFNVFRPLDLFGILLPGAFLTVIFLFVFPGDTLTAITIKLAPVSLAVLLVMPIPYYHNVLVYLREVYLYFNNQRRYYWRGWCASYVGSDGNAEQTESKR